MKTIKQKIEDLTFADLIKKLKDILSNYSSKFESITGRISTLESNASSGGGGSILTIDQVLDLGSTAIDKAIFFETSYDDMFGRVGTGGLLTSNGNGTDTEIFPGGLIIQEGFDKIDINANRIILQTSTSAIQLKIPDDISEGGNIQNLPNKSGTIALLSDIPSGVSGIFANPTSITVVNGVIKAIS